MKGLRFARKSLARIWQPIDWLLGFTPRRRCRIGKTEDQTQVAPARGLNVNVMSFNIRRGTARDGRNHWMYRRNRVQEILNHYRPDVLGVQEAMDFQVAAIRHMLPGYAVVGEGNMGGSEGMHNAIFYDTGRFSLAEEGTFWLSDAPDTPGSRGWGNIIHRTCSWARLIERGSGQGFYFYNTHLDHISLRSRKRSVILLAQRIEARSYPDPFILTGDFNARERSAPIQYLKGKVRLGSAATGRVLNPNPLMDSFRVRHPHHRHPGTFHGFRRFFFRFRLDYIFVPPSIQVREAQIITMRCKNRYPSDHFPLLSTISLPECGVPYPARTFLQDAVNG
ncbi:MAG: endonuclease/exonuclease/phosphatase family protein [Syntrophales bacterium]